MGTSSRSRVAAEDLTARARIRDAALEAFAEHGFDRATIRSIARDAGVSPGLVRHHFGSKEDLRRACDAYTLAEMNAYLDRATTDEGLNDPRTVGPARDAVLPFRRYLARALIDGSVAAGQMFDAMVMMTERALAAIDRHRCDQPAADLRTRAALMVAMALGIPAFREQISHSIGADIFSPEGDRRIALALLDIHSHPTLTPENAKAMQRGLDGDPGQ